MKLIQYIRDEERVPFGCVVAIGKDQIGWSLVNEEGGDVFNKNLALKIAEGRIQSVKTVLAEIEEKVNNRLGFNWDSEDLYTEFPRLARVYYEILRMRDRSEAYFKTVV